MSAVRRDVNWNEKLLLDTLKGFRTEKKLASLKQESILDIVGQGIRFEGDFHQIDEKWIDQNENE